MSILIRGARVFSAGGVMPRADILIEGGRIAQVGNVTASADRVIRADGCVVMPGFIDAHTHAMWAGDRLDEFEQKQRGATYLEILKSGGGILSTVRAVRSASQEDLTGNLLRRLVTALAEGTTTIEVKSGYGLTTAGELKMLRAIAAAAKQWPGTVVPTALLGHAIDPEQKNFVDTVINETLPAVHAEFPRVAVDAFCEKGAWSVEDCRRLFERAIALEHPIRIHADQFNRLGGLDLAIELKARSVDHLEASTADDLARLARSGTFGVMLPACGFHLDERYGNARAFLDAGGKLVLASNCNPGSAPTSSMAMVGALAVRKLKMTCHEAMTAMTATAADLLNLGDRGRVEVGKRADLIVLRHKDERELCYEFGGNPVRQVIVGGQLLEASRADIMPGESS